MRFVKLGGDLVARPLKQGVDYFPLDVYLDDKFKFIEIKYKLEGFAILVKLMQRIYSQGYWCRWTDDELLLFSDEIRADTQLVKDVVSECLERVIFNKHLYDSFNILTSKGIQKRYKEIVRRRKEVEVTEEYLLIDNILNVNDVNNPSSSEQDDGKSTQRKGKESKGNENKEEIPYTAIVDYLNQKADKNFKPTSNKTRDQIKARWNEGHRLNDFKIVIDVCCQKWKGQIFGNGQSGDSYLQPSTLFNGKFDGRLNWSVEKQSSKPKKSRDQIEHEQMLKEMGMMD